MVLDKFSGCLKWMFEAITKFCIYRLFLLANVV